MVDFSAAEALAALGPVAWYVLAMAATPGPNNAMLAASGMNFGFARTTPHILGIVGGLVALFAACSMGLGVLFQSVPYAKLALSIIGALYLAYLAWRVANAAAPSASDGARPLSFLEAAGFQFLNPKGWVMALTAATLTPSFGGPVQAAVALGLVGIAVATPSMAIWAAFGVAIARVLKDESARKWINRCLALILLATIPFMFR